MGADLRERALSCSAKTEYAYWRDHSTAPDKAAIFADSVAPIVEAGRADLVASDARICDEITLIPTPGHSPGHVSLHIRSDGEEGLLTGDVAHHPCQMAHLDWSSTANSDPGQSAQTRRELFSRFADRPVLVIGGHFDAGHIKRDGDAFKFIAAGAKGLPGVRGAALHASWAVEFGRRCSMKRPKP